MPCILYHVQAELVGQQPTHYFFLSCCLCYSTANGNTTTNSVWDFDPHVESAEVKYEQIEARHLFQIQLLAHASLWGRISPKTPMQQLSSTLWGL